MLSGQREKESERWSRRQQVDVKVDVTGKRN